MKRCPKCNLEFDDELRFCLEDGTALVGDQISPTVASPTMVLPTREETPPTMTQAARPDVPAPPHLAPTRTAANIETAAGNSGSSRTMVIIGTLLGAGLLFSFVGLGVWGIFYARRIPMILLCLFGMVLAISQAKKHSTASLMVGISLGLYLLETFVISTANYYIPRILYSFALGYQTSYLTVSVIDSLAFAAVIILLTAAVFAGRSSRSTVHNQRKTL